MIQSGGVYPRVYGGTPIPISPPWATEGLSPRVRGNQLEGGQRGDVCRSIPACTGEPPCGPPPVPSAPVYPRVYGGTNVVITEAGTMTGLSPRVRGNPVIVSVNTESSGSIPACTGEPLDAIACRRHPSGSIPACTGEPGVLSRHYSPPPVYPRVYGGTAVPVTVTVPVDGLSPRVRGNPEVSRSKPIRQRSIPACTGEPLNGFVIFCSPF